MNIKKSKNKKNNNFKNFFRKNNKNTLTQIDL